MKQNLSHPASNEIVELVASFWPAAISLENFIGIDFVAEM